MAELKPPPGFVLDTPPPPPGFQLDNPSSQASPTEPRSIGGFARNVVSSGGNFIGNVANAVLHPIDTGKGVLDAAAGGISKMAGTGQYFPQQVQSAEAIGNAYKQRYGSLENIGNTLYNDPVGAAADASALLSGGSALAGGTGAIAKTLNLPRVASAMDTTANAARVAGDVSNPISFPGRMVKNTGSITKALGEGTSSAGFPSASRALENTGQSIENLGSGKATRNMAGYSSNRLWQSAMKPQNFPALDVNDRRRIISTMQREDIPLSMGVVDEVDRRIEAVNAKIAKGIAERTEQGAEIDPTKVAPYADQVRARFQDVNPETAQNAISSVKAEYLRKHSIEAPYTKIKPTAQSGFADEPGLGAYVSDGEGVTQVPQSYPLAEGQAEKQNTYRKLKDSAYGEQKTPEAETKKALARGLKDQIVELFPEIKALNAQDSDLINLMPQLERFVGRYGNRQMMGIGKLGAGVAGEVVGGPLGATGMFLAKLALDDPAIKTRIANMLYKYQISQQSNAVNNITEATKRLMTQGASYQNLSNPAPIMPRKQP